MRKSLVYIRLGTLIIILLNLWISAFNQEISIEAIKISPEYYWGEGTGNSSHEASINSLSDLTSSISVMVESRYDQKTIQIINNKNIEFQETVNSVINTYSNITVDNPSRITIQSYPYYRIFTYIRKNEVEKAFVQRERKVINFINLADSEFEKLNISDALRYYYWGLKLLISLPDGHNIKYETKYREVILLHYIYDRINNIFSNIKFQITEVVDQQYCRLFIIKATYKNDDIANLDLSFVDNKTRTYLFPLKDSFTTMELCGQDAHKNDNLLVKVEYLYENEVKIRRDHELESVFATLGVIEFEPAIYSLKISGKLNITSEPAGASVIIGGNDAGKTPLNVDLVLGNHLIEVTFPGYSPIKEEINMSNKPFVNLHYSLDKSKFIIINSNPDNAYVYLNGDLIGQTPIKTEVGCGSYNIKGTFRNMIVEGKIEVEEYGPTDFFLNIPLPEITVSVNDIDIELVYIGGGVFQMGCVSRRLRDCYDNEIPSQTVYLNSFYLAKYETTRGQWFGITQTDTSSVIGIDHNNYPIESVTWINVQDYITKLNQVSGFSFRLPTEAEWEYAASGGKNSMNYIYAGSNELLDTGWFSSNSGSTTMPVGTKKANELGIHDMSGNVFEWCHDWYSLYVFSEDTINIPTGPLVGAERVIRGGSWSSPQDECRIKARNRMDQHFSRSNIGFRLVLPFIGIIYE